jgi:16S rRNA (adenine1518-N6/adenine1519-N6)-dimethyltransferase
VDFSRISPIHVPSLLDKYGLRPSKGLGQNFLTDENILRKVVDTAEISVGDLVLEIGPGLGSMTRYLATDARQVIAVELDEKLLPALHETLSPFDNIKLVIGDILELDPAELISSFPAITEHQPPSSAENTKQVPESRPPSYKVVANIPYYITSALIRHLLEAKFQPNSMVLTIQKEVAQRICEKPPKMSLLALSVQVYGTPKMVAKIPAGAFYPKPKVDSAVVKIDLFPSPVVPTPQIPIFFRLAKAGFSQKRKTLRNSLAAGMAWPKEYANAILEEAEIDPQRRAQTLSLDEWGTLTDRASTKLEF